MRRSRILFILGFIFVLFGYLSWSLLQGLHAHPGMRLVGILSLLLLFFMILMIPFRIWKDRNRITVGFWDRFQPWLSYLSMGVLSFIFFYVLTRDSIWVILRFALGADTAAVLRGVAATALVLLLTLLSVLYSVLREMLFIRIDRVEVVLEKLDPAFDGIRIAQLSDIHIGPTIRNRFLRRIVNDTNALEPDIIAITGDLADGKVNDLRHVAGELKSLNAPLGRFYVVGNHEFYWGARPWIEFMNSIGFKSLVNEHVVIEKNEKQIVMSGVTDVVGANFDQHLSYDPARALTHAPPEAVNILLCHQPHTARSHANMGYDLQLSGHTHAGQFIPWTWLIYLFQPFVKGLYKVESMWLYINRGTGTWGPPLRFGAPPEITLLTLKSKSARNS